jgi:nitrous oxidase accessory protein NosD
MPTVNMLMRIINNKIYSASKDCIFISNVKARMIEIAKNDILKNNAIGIRLSNVTGINNDPTKILVRNNLITDCQVGYGIYVDSSSLTLEHNDLRKNHSDAIHITSNSSSSTKHHIIISNCIC